jgi:predicted dehydrogenase
LIEVEIILFLKKRSERESLMKRVLMIGAGGWARQCWIDEVLPHFRNSITIAGIADKSEEALKEAANILNVSPEDCFTNLAEAFAKTPADFCIICIPPAHHREAVLLAADKGMHVLSEKPIADTKEDAAAIRQAVARSGVKMAITQNYRFEIPILTFKDILQSGRLGRLDYIIARYSSDYRQPYSWGVDHVHERDNPLLIEGAIHHLDMLRNFTGSNCKSLFGTGWNPSWSSFKDNPNCLIFMEMENGVKAVYEGNSLESGEANNWFHEYYRAQCENGVVKIDQDQIVRIYQRDANGAVQVEEVAPVSTPLTGHDAILTSFLEWQDGGKPTETHLEDNIYSAAMVYSAIASFRDKSLINVTEYLP